MSMRLFFFGLWCAALLGFCALVSVFAWDPFADGSATHSEPARREHHHGGYGGYWGFGPSHK